MEGWCRFRRLADRTVDVCVAEIAEVVVPCGPRFVTPRKTRTKEMHTRTHGNNERSTNKNDKEHKMHTNDDQKPLADTNKDSH